MSQTSINIESIGPKSAPEIVLLHGWGMNNAVFTPLRDHLSQYRVHYVDLPGFGHSQPVEGDIKDWVNALIANTPDSAIWVGWSLGGLIAMQTAIHYPDKVKGLVTVASSPCFMAREQEKWPGIPPQVLTQFSQSLQQDLPKTIERFLAIQAMGSKTAKEDIKQLRALVLAKPLPDPMALIQGLDMLKSVDLRPELHHIKQPWLRIWGRLDGLVPRHVPGQMPQQLENSRDIMLNKASHAPFITHTEAFSQELITWIEETTH